MSAAVLRPLGVVLLMLGFGLRLDTAWQGLAWVLLAVGGIAAAAGLLQLPREGDRFAAFVPPPGKR